MRRLAASAILLLASSALAIEPDEQLEDPALEARARAISREIRCVVCQSESVDDSSAPLARDLRLLIRERLAAGDSDDEVIAFLVERYGDFVLQKPRLKATTVLLWAAPALAAAAGAIALWRVIRARPAPPGDAE
jgi:cytochrome c-type biogenesis protein CcmH